MNLRCGSYSRAGLILSLKLKLRVSFKGGPLSRAVLFQGFTVAQLRLALQQADIAPEANNVLKR